MCVWERVCVCELHVSLSILRTETRLCLLQPLRKIYLYLQFDAFNPVRAQVTVRQEEGTRASAGVHSEL